MKGLTKIYLIFFILLFSFTDAYTQWLSGYDYRIKLTIQSSKVAGAADHIDCPVLVVLTADTLRTIGNGGFMFDSNGWDTRFTTSDGTTTLDHEIEDYSPTSGNYVAWVRIPALTPLSDTDIYLYFGNSTIGTDPSTATTWNSDYVGVWHMNENADDASQQGNNGSLINGPVSIPGRIDDGVSFDGNNDYLNVPHDNTLSVTSMTISLWMKPTALDNVVQAILRKGVQANYQLSTVDDELRFEFNTVGWELFHATDANLSINQWYYVVATFEEIAGEGKVYIDTVLRHSSTSVKDPTGNTADLTIGGIETPIAPWPGMLDEVRISTVSQSSDWIKTQFNSQIDPASFYFSGSFESDAPVITSDGGGATASVNVAENTTTVTTVTATDAESDPITYSISGGADAAKFNINSSTGLLTFIVAPDFETPTDADTDNVYYVTVQASDGTGTDTQDISVTVTNVAPIDVSASGTNNVDAGAVYTLNLSADEDVTSWTINWGDGTIETVVGDPPSVNHTYTNSGFTYNISVSAQDTDGTYFKSALLIGNAPSGTDGFVLRYGYDPLTGLADTAGVQTLNTPTPSDLDWAADVVVGPDGNIYATGYQSGNIVRFNGVTGAFMDIFVNMTQPVSLAFGPDGNLYVASDLNYVKRFDSTNGDYIDDFLTLAYTPEEMTFGPDGNLYVGAYTANMIYRYNGMTGAALDGGSAFIDPTGGSTDDDLSYVEQFTFGPDSNVYVASMTNGKIQRYDGTTGTWMGTFATPGTTGAGWPRGPTGIAFGPDGHVYVTTVNRVELYDGSTGGYIDDYVPTGGVLDNPWFSTFTPQQQVYVNNNAPVITSDGGGTTASVNVAENQAAITIVTATDANGDPITYSISGGADGALFSINSSTGVLTFIAAPDFETPTDADIDNVYEVTVQASDSIDTDTQAISVSVTDVTHNMIVTTTADLSDGDTSSAEALNASKGLDNAISLREAIMAANNSAETVTISFNITDPLVGGAHPFSIGPGGLPPILDTVILDGTTEPDFLGTPIIVLDGSGAGSVSGLTLSADSSTINGLVINNFSEHGILINGNSNTFTGNYIGTDHTGLLDEGNGVTGIFLTSGAENNLIGGSTSADRNIISGNGDDNVKIEATSGSGNTLIGNYIGVDALGTSVLGNGGSGIDIQADGNTIGDTIIGARNIISGSLYNGVVVSGDDNTIQGNYIGSDVTGTQDRGNGRNGIWITGGSNNKIGGTEADAGNLIFSNGRNGILVSNGTPTNNAILGNSIFDNTWIGIDLSTIVNGDSVTNNDANDLDFGPNSLQNYPLITSVCSTGDSTRIVGALNSGSDTTFVIEFYSSPAADPTGNGEGEVYLGFTTITTDGSGNATFDITIQGVSVSEGHFVSATATVDLGGGSYGNTSEFSANVAAAEQPLANAGSGGDECDLDFILSATASVGTGTWSKQTGPGNALYTPDLNSPNATVTVDAYGSYIFRWTEVNGACNDFDEISVSFTEPSVVGPDQDICGVLVTTVAGNAPTIGVGTWTQVSGPGTVGFGDINVNNTTATADAYGTYVLRWTLVNGTCSTQDDVTINYAEAAAAGPDQDICGVLVTTLAGNAPTIGVGTWTQVSGPGTVGFGDINVNNTTATADAYGTYVLRWTVVNGACSTQEDVTINYAEAAAAGPDQDICGVLVTTLAGNAPTIGVGTWTQVSGPGTVGFGDINVNNTTATADAYGMYVLRWTLVNGTCSTQEDVTINYAEAVAAGPDQDICGVLVTTLAGNAPTIGVGTWTQVSGPGTVGFGDINVNNTTATADAYGTYVLRWTVVNGSCNTQDDVTINYAEAAAAGPDQDICGVLVTTLAGNAPTIGVGTWTQVSGPGTVGFGDINVNSTTATADAYGTYVLRWTVVNGTCSTQEDVTINYAEAAAAGPDQDICGVLVATLAGNPPTIGVGTWTQVSGPGTVSFGDINVNNTTATADAYGTYVLRWTLVNGACSTQEDVTINYAEATAAGPDQDICGVLVTTLAGTPTIGVGTWTQVSGPGTVGFGDINVNNSTATADAYGTYVLRWTVVNGTCSTQDDVTINYAEAAAAGPDQDICGVLSATLVGNAPTTGTGTWTQVSGPGTISFGDVNVNNTSATADANGIYELQWTIDNNSCSSSDRVFIGYDASDPVILCPGNLNADCQISEHPTFADLAAFISAGGSATDNCGIDAASFTLISDVTDGLSCPESITRTYEITNDNGNTATCQHNIIINDNIDPIFDTFPGNLTADCDISEHPSYANYAAFVDAGGSASDNCGIDPASFSLESEVSDGLSNPETITRTYWIADFCGNTNSFTQEIVLTDSLDPEIICPPDLQQSVDQGICSASIFVSLPEVSDNCSITSVINDFNGLTDASGIYPVGTTPVTWTVTDLRGNTATCVQNITINDDLEPQIICPADRTENVDDQCEFIIPDYTGSAIANDNCTTDPIVSQSPSSGTKISGSGTVQEIVLTALDGAGNETGCTFSIVLQDNSLPVVSSLRDTLVTIEDGTFEIQLTPPVPVFTDNCGILSVVNAFNGGTDASGIYPLGTTIVAYTVTDINGNSALFNQEIIVQLENEPDYGLVIPEVFTPNEDGLNDRFEILGIEQYPDNELVIYNVNGQEVFRMINYDNSWDGVPSSNLNDGKKLPTGTYYYVIYLDGTDAIIKGFIYLRRD